MLKNLRGKLSFSFIFLNIISAFILSLTIYLLSLSMFISDFRMHKLSIANFISKFLDPQEHVKFNSQEALNISKYNYYLNLFKSYYEQEKNIKYIYTLNYDNKKNKLTYAIDSNSIDRTTIWIDSKIFSLNATIENGKIVIDYDAQKYYKNFIFPIRTDTGSTKIDVVFSEDQKIVNLLINSILLFEINIVEDSLLLKFKEEYLNKVNRKIESNFSYKKVSYPINFTYTQKLLKETNPGMDYIESQENIEKVINILQSNSDFIDDEPTVGNYGSYLSAYSLIRDANNNPIGVVVIEVDDSKISEYKSNLAIINIVVFFITVLFSISISLVLANYFTKPLGLLINAVETLGSGNLETLVDISSDDEFGKLSKSFNLMVSNLKIASEVQYNLITEISQLNDSLEQKVATRTKTIQAQSIELEKQIQIAQKIQMSLLPEAIPDIESARVSFKYQPMMGVGGDFTDFYYKNNDELILFICDVSGHGVPAAFLATMVKMTLQTCYESMLRPADSLRKIHKSLLGKMSGHFISAMYCSIDLSTGVMKFSNAGHLAPVRVSKEGEVNYIQSKGRVISEILPVKVEEQTILLLPGDKIILYTDGITEARNTQNEMLGDERFLKIIKENYKCSTAEMSATIYTSVLSFTGNVTGQFTDDITILTAEYLG